MPNALFRCDGGAKVGAGHVMRCTALARALEAEGWRCWFATSRAAAPLVEGRRPIVVPDGEAGARAVAEVVAAKRIDCLCVDHYGLGASFERAARGAARVVAVLDDLADRRHDCDLLVDSGPLRRASDYARCGTGSARLLLGPRYALMRPEVVRSRRARRPRRSGRRGRLLVTLGGADPAGLSGRILGTLPPGEKTGLDTLLVVGPANRRRRALVRQAAAAGVRCVVAPRDLARWMAAASLAVTAGGVTASELACVGVPMVIVVAAENQRESARGLVRARAAVALDGTTAAGIRGVGAAVCRLAKDPLRRRRMAAAGRRLVDGRGAARVARALTQLLAARREDERS